MKKLNLSLETGQKTSHTLSPDMNFNEKTVDTKDKNILLNKSHTLQTKPNKQNVLSVPTKKVGIKNEIDAFGGNSSKSIKSSLFLKKIVNNTMENNKNVGFKNFISHIGTPSDQSLKIIENVKNEELAIGTPKALRALVKKKKKDQNSNIYTRRGLEDVIIDNFLSYDKDGEGFQYEDPLKLLCKDLFLYFGSQDEVPAYEAFGMLVAMNENKDGKYSIEIVLKTIPNYLLEQGLVLMLPENKDPEPKLNILGAFFNTVKKLTEKFNSFWGGMNYNSLYNKLTEIVYSIEDPVQAKELASTNKDLMPFSIEHMLQFAENQNKEIRKLSVIILTIYFRYCSILQYVNKVNENVASLRLGLNQQDNILQQANQWDKKRLDVKNNSHIHNFNHNKKLKELKERIKVLKDSDDFIFGYFNIYDIQVVEDGLTTRSKASKRRNFRDWMNFMSFRKFVQFKETKDWSLIPDLSNITIIIPVLPEECDVFQTSSDSSVGSGSKQQNQIIQEQKLRDLTLDLQNSEIKKFEISNERIRINNQHLADKNECGVKRNSRTFKDFREIKERLNKYQKKTDYTIDRGPIEAQIGKSFVRHKEPESFNKIMKRKNTVTNAKSFKLRKTNTKNENYFLNKFPSTSNTPINRIGMEYLIDTTPMGSRLNEAESPETYKKANVFSNGYGSDSEDDTNILRHYDKDSTETNKFGYTNTDTIIKIPSPKKQSDLNSTNNKEYLHINLNTTPRNNANRITKSATPEPFKRHNFRVKANQIFNNLVSDANKNYGVRTNLFDDINSSEFYKNVKNPNKEFENSINYIHARPKTFNFLKNCNTNFELPECKPEGLLYYNDFTINKLVPNYNQKMSLQDIAKERAKMHHIRYKNQILPQNGNTINIMNKSADCFNSRNNKVSQYSRILVNGENKVNQNKLPYSNYNIKLNSIKSHEASPKCWTETRQAKKSGPLVKSSYYESDLTSFLRYGTTNLGSLELQNATELIDEQNEKIRKFITAERKKTMYTTKKNQRKNVRKESSQELASRNQLDLTDESKANRFFMLRKK